MAGPHQDQPLRTAGTPVDEASAAVVAVHGRGASAGSVLDLAGEFDVDGVAYLAPQAARNTWYPNSFLQPVESNEPGRSSGLQAVGEAIERANEAVIPTERVAVLGFSQGACLASEFVARNPQEFGGLVAFSGGLIGETVTVADYVEDADGSLAGTPAFLGCSDVDPHIPVERVHVTEEVLADLGADVEKRIYEGMGHGINEDEIEYVTGMIEALVAE
jgi:phospholipase/carboxylesterase